MSKTIDKPWGREIVLTGPEHPYTGKVIELKKGQRWSLQYHDQKTETFSLFSGKAILYTGSDMKSLAKNEMELLESYTINPGTIHRIQALEDSIIFEVSTPEIGTTFRIEDDYQRPNETEDIRNLPNRGWNNE